MFEILWLFPFLLKITAITARNEEYVLQTKSLPVDLNFMPTLSNGHLGYTIYGDAIFVNGVYNGEGGDSRRARIPNWLNISVGVERPDGTTLLDATNATSLYEMNLEDGYFRSVQTIASHSLQVEQFSYPHRYYNRALVYELRVHRTQGEEPLVFKLTQTPGAESDAFNFSRLSREEFGMLMGVTKEVENEEFQKDPTKVFIAFNDELGAGKTLEMSKHDKELNFRYIITIDTNEYAALQEMNSVLELDPQHLRHKHVAQWHKFWQDFNISLNENLELSQTINAAIFYLASALPSPHTNLQTNAYYGLSPTGLGRGQTDDDYMGHNFWDTEVWMFPVVLQLSTAWASELLQYRLDHLSGAQYNAKLTSYRGARFPWESAYTGTEVTNKCCPEVAHNEVHISPDIAWALQQYYAATAEQHWLCPKAWPLLREIAAFLESRVKWREQSAQYHVYHVMGPDEDHEKVNDSVYTNSIFKIALQFASYVQHKCAPESHSENWRHIAKNMELLYDAKLDYHPEYEGYPQGEMVKQADVILLGYPLQVELKDSTRLNDLTAYESVTRDTGPAMTWSMFAINFLDVCEFDKADEYFVRGYKNYVHPEFKVWSETKIGDKGSANFLTGIGGFLQAVINGYGGIRYRRVDDKSVMEIKTRRLLPDTQEMTITGIKFAGAEFMLNIKSSTEATLTCLHTSHKKLVLIKVEERYNIIKHFSLELDDAEITITTA